MHPVEHFLLMSDTLIFFLIASHPVHVIYDLIFHGIGAPLSHTGFDKLKLGKRIQLNVGDFTINCTIVLWIQTTALKTHH